MLPLTLTFDILKEISDGFIDGRYVRRGAVIQDLSGRVVMWLREYQGGGVGIPFGPNPIDPVSYLLPNLNPATGVFNLARSGVNAGISIRGFAAVTRQLNQIQGMLNIATASSILNLGVSAIGFVTISNLLREVEKRLEEIQKRLEKIDRKVDLSFYANFRAALDLANNAFTMSKGDNRRSSALSAINRFLEAEHIYADLVDREFEQNSQIGDEYLLTLCLAYIAEARCYLELEEIDTAVRRYQEGKKQIRSRIEKYVDTLLTSKPLMYLHPALKEETSLVRLTKIYQ